VLAEMSIITDSSMNGPMTRLERPSKTKVGVVREQDPSVFRGRYGTLWVGWNTSQKTFQYCPSWRYLSMDFKKDPFQNTNSTNGQKGYWGMDFLKDLFRFLWERKAWWIAPMMLVLLLIGILLVMGGSSSMAPFIYTLF
jgi:hypothetical protein